MKVFQVLQVLEGKNTASVYATHLDEKEARRAADSAKNTPPLSSPERTSRYFLVPIEAEELMAEPKEGDATERKEGRLEQLGEGGKPDEDRPHTTATRTPAEAKDEAVGYPPRDEGGHHGKRHHKGHY